VAIWIERIVTTIIFGITTSCQGKRMVTLYEKIVVDDALFAIQIFGIVTRLDHSSL
jgi:hypothetical protein